MFTWKNHTFRGLRSKANSRRSKNHNFSNHFTEIQLERATEDPNPLKYTQKSSPGHQKTPRGASKASQSASRGTKKRPQAPPQRPTSPPNAPERPPK